MHECDITLKLLLAESADEALRQLGADGKVKRWLNVELPSVQNRRVDLVAELDTVKLLHIELQSTNDPEMALRMLEYAACILRRDGRYPRQVLLYVGNEKSRMQERIDEEGMNFWYRLVDIRDLDGEALLASDRVSDNILALLASVEDRVDAIRRILKKIIGLEQGKREGALQRLLLTCGMRGLAVEAKEEWKNMAISYGIEDNEVLGPPYREGKREGREEGREEGKKEGREEEEEGGDEESCPAANRTAVWSTADLGRRTAQREIAN